MIDNFKNVKTMEKELYYTNNKLISKLNIYFDLSPSQFNDASAHSFLENV